MGSGFSGFPGEGIRFLRSLARNNKRDWFQPRKHIFDGQVKAPMVEMVAALNRAMAEFAPEYSTDPAKAIFRIYRDTRFSKDKTPYKDHIAASFPRRGMPRTGEGGYYFSVSDKEIEVGGGVYMPQPETLLAIRRHVAANHEELRRLLADRTVKRLLGDLQGDQLARMPKGFATDHPAADLIRFKSYILYTTLAPDIATTPRLFTEVLKRFQAMTPFLNFITHPLVRPKAQQKRPKSGHFDDRYLPVAF
jgi:uncharacterized protein (TIGR02453 family)